MQYIVFPVLVLVNDNFQNRLMVNQR